MTETGLLVLQDELYEDPGNVHLRRVYADELERNGRVIEAYAQRIIVDPNNEQLLQDYARVLEQESHLRAIAGMILNPDEPFTSQERDRIADHFRPRDTSTTVVPVLGLNGRAGFMCLWPDLRHHAQTYVTGRDAYILVVQGKIDRIFIPWERWLENADEMHFRHSIKTVYLETPPVLQYVSTKRVRFPKDPRKRSFSTNELPNEKGAGMARALCRKLWPLVKSWNTISPVEDADAYRRRKIEEDLADSS